MKDGTLAMSLRLSIFFILFFAAFSAHSVIILKVKNQRCLIDLEGASHEIGDYFEALDLYGKARGIVRISKLKGNKAIGQVVDGVIGSNWILEQTSKNKLTTEVSIPVRQQPRKFYKKRLSHYFGILPSVNYSFLARPGNKAATDTVRFVGLGGGGYVYMEFNILPYFALSVHGGTQYVSLKEKNQSQGHSFCINPSVICSTWMFWLPHLKLTAQLSSAVIIKRFNAFIGAGASFTHWGINDAEYRVMAKEAYLRIQSSAHTFVGINFLIPKLNLKIPVVFDVTLVQPWSVFFGSENTISIYQLSLQTGIAFSF